MSIEEEAANEFRRSEDERARSWRNDGTRATALSEAINTALSGGPYSLGRQHRSKAPYKMGLGLSPEWQRSDLVVEVPDDEDSEPFPFYVRTDVLEVYAVGECPKCGVLVPLGPPVRDLSDLGAALLFGTPASGHHYPGVSDLGSILV